MATGSCLTERATVVAGADEAESFVFVTQQGGTFTVSNLGGFDIDTFTAVINPPQVCTPSLPIVSMPLRANSTPPRALCFGQAAILAVGRGEKRMAFADDESDELVVETVMNVTLSADRRVLEDGAAAHFLQVLQNYIEVPHLL